MTKMPHSLSVANLATLALIHGDGNSNRPIEMLQPLLDAGCVRFEGIGIALTDYGRACLGLPVVPTAHMSPRRGYGVVVRPTGWGQG